MDAGYVSSYSKISYSQAWKGEIVKHPVVTIAMGDIDRNLKDEIAVVSSAPANNDDADTVARVRVLLGKASALGLSPEQMRGLPSLLPAASSPDAGRDSRRDILAALQQGQSAPLPTGGAPAQQAKSSLVADAERLAAGREEVRA